MSREPYSAEDQLFVDRCRACDKIWLDDGELGHLCTQRELKTPPVAPGFFEGLRRLIGLTPRIL